MNPQKLSGHLLVWGAENIEAGTIDQAAKCARLPFLGGDVALMPDAHVGIGATVGSVIPTVGAIIPAAVGVDIGCGMIAVETDAHADRLPDDLDALMPTIEDRIPAGVAQGHQRRSGAAEQWYADHNLPSQDRPGFKGIDVPKILDQFGTLGSGNHFLEICLDERDVVWVVLHSGSRGIGNKLATGHIDKAKKLAKQWFLQLEDSDLAYFVQGTPEFGAYISDMHWAQDYAMANRDRMMDETLRTLGEAMPFTEQRRVNCHHNFTAMEKHHGRNMWVTRKGAIRAREGDTGVIPGSMGTRSYIVHGLGNPASYHSCSHGAGRTMSRKKAREAFTEADLTARMGDRAWNRDKAKSLIDEIPDAYKDIDAVMEAQQDLVAVEHTLRQVFNYKGA